MTTQLKVNGNAVTVDVDEDTPLLWVIRDFLGLTGTKFGCGKGLCGACTVKVNGNAIRSCLTQLSSVAGADIRTIESLQGSEPDLVRVWVKNNVAQCGYCQPGQLMSASALLASNGKPSDTHIYRCG